jgi:hypothetical protein
MKILIKAHVITAILGWIFIVIVGVITLNEGSLVGIASLCLMGVATFITIVDVASVYLTKKEKIVAIISRISTAFWGIVLVLYGMGLFSPNQPWQSRVVFGVLIATALFKVIASVSLVKELHHNIAQGN